MRCCKTSSCSPLSSKPRGGIDDEDEHEEEDEGTVPGKRRRDRGAHASCQRSFPYRRSLLRAAPDRRVQSWKSTPRKIHAPPLKRQPVFQLGAANRQTLACSFRAAARPI